MTAVIIRQRRDADISSSAGWQSRSLPLSPRFATDAEGLISSLENTSVEMSWALWRRSLVLCVEDGDVSVLYGGEALCLYEKVISRALQIVREVILCCAL